MLLFKKKDLLVVISKSGDTVQFTKPLNDILKYQHRYNYKFKMYENGKVTVADDYIIEGDTLTVLFGSATVSYTSEGASYMEGGGSGGGSGEGGCDCGLFKVTLTKNNNDITADKTYAEIAQLLSDGKLPVAFLVDADTNVGTVSSNQYLFIDELVATFTFEYSYKESEQSHISYVSRTVAMTPDGTISEETVLRGKIPVNNG